MIEFGFALALILLGAYALLFKDNFIKKVIGLSVLSNGIHLLFIAIGFAGALATARPPILTGPEVGTLPLVAVDPLPQALVLTSIVINVSVTAFALMLSIYAYKLFGTLRTKEWDK